jgi:3-oxoadipate enol-lactonase
MEQVTKRRLGAVVALLSLLLVVSACTNNRAAGTSSTTVPVASTTSTTLSPLLLGGTKETGALGFLGTVRRLPVEAVPDGALSVAVPAPGTPGYASVVQIAYRQMGSGKPLVLIEGEDASMSWWSPVLLQELAGHYQVTVFDLPGVGYSGPATAPVTMDWLGDVTAGLISELKIPSPVVLGWGLGGQVAAGLAERHPGLIGDLVLVDTGLPVGSSKPMSKASSAAFSGFPSSPEELSGFLFTSKQEPARTAWLSALRREVPDSITAETVAAEHHLEVTFWRHTDIAARLRALRVPALVVTGMSDGVFPPGDGRQLARAIPGAQRYGWNGAGYGSLLGDPTHFAQLLEGFTG